MSSIGAEASAEEVVKTVTKSVCKKLIDALSDLSNAVDAQPPNDLSSLSEPSGSNPFLTGVNIPTAYAARAPVVAPEVTVRAVPLATGSKTTESQTTLQPKIHSSVQTEPLASPAFGIPVASDVLHLNITCDNCEGQVRGIRYKCNTCPDYDLCSSCEPLPVHPEDHSFIKIKKPIRNSRCPFGRFGPMSYGFPTLVPAPMEPPGLPPRLRFGAPKPTGKSVLLEDLRNMLTNIRSASDAAQHRRPGPREDVFILADLDAATQQLSNIQIRNSEEVTEQKLDDLFKKTTGKKSGEDGKSHKEKITGHKKRSDDSEPCVRPKESKRSKHEKVATDHLPLAQELSEFVPLQLATAPLLAASQMDPIGPQPKPITDDGAPNGPLATHSRHGKILYMSGVVLSDETVPSETKLLPGSMVKKVWRVKNNGNKSWNGKTTIKCVWRSDEFQNEVSENIAIAPVPKPPRVYEFPVPPLRPSQEGKLVAKFRLPNSTGLHVSHWRLHYRGRPFGPRMTCSVVLETAVALNWSEIETRPLLRDETPEKLFGKDMVGDYGHFYGCACSKCEKKQKDRDYREKKRAEKTLQREERRKRIASCISGIAGGITSAAIGSAGTGMTSAALGLTSAAAGITSAAAGITSAATGMSSPAVGFASAATGITSAVVGITSAAAGITSATASGIGSAIASAAAHVEAARNARAISFAIEDSLEQTGRDSDSKRMVEGTITPKTPTNTPYAGSPPKSPEPSATTESAHLSLPIDDEESEATPKSLIEMSTSVDRFLELPLQPVKVTLENSEKNGTSVTKETPVVSPDVAAGRGSSCSNVSEEYQVLDVPEDDRLSVAGTAHFIAVSEPQPAKEEELKSVGSKNDAVKSEAGTEPVSGDEYPDADEWEEGWSGGSSGESSDEFQVIPLPKCFDLTHPLESKIDGVTQTSEAEQSAPVSMGVSADEMSDCSSFSDLEYAEDAMSESMISRQVSSISGQTGASVPVGSSNAASEILEPAGEKACKTLPESGESSAPFSIIQTSKEADNKTESVESSFFKRSSTNFGYIPLAQTGSSNEPSIEPAGAVGGVEITSNPIGGSGLPEPLDRDRRENPTIHVLPETLVNGAMSAASHVINNFGRALFHGKDQEVCVLILCSIET